MTNDPTIEEGLLILRRIFDHAGKKGYALFEYALEDNPTVLEKTAVDLVNVLPDIKINVMNQGLYQHLSLSFQHRAPNDKIMDGKIPVSEEHVDDVADFKKLTQAIEYRKQNFGMP